jgi:outer membrane protein assembly factor BamD (BamD/ComL family)
MLARVALAAAVLLAGAPLQCGHTPEAELQEDETPGDALWKLARQFHDRHDAEAERTTLRYLVERYPASRWAGQAREALAALGGGDGTSTGGAGASAGGDGGA